MRKDLRHIKERARSSQSAPDGYAFIVPYTEGVDLRIIISWGSGWDHVSVHAFDYVCEGSRTPTWDEMCFVKDLVFRKDETVVQFHPRRDQYVNCHPHVLHLWREQRKRIRLPPTWMIGPKKQNHNRKE